MDLQTRTDYLARLMEEKLGVRGKGLEAKLKRAGRQLPRYIRDHGAALVEAQALQDHPRLSMHADPDRLERAYADIERYLKGLDLWARRRDTFLNWLAGLSASFLFLVVILLALLRWRGFL